MLTKIISKIRSGTHAKRDDGTLDLPPVETCSLEMLKRSDDHVPQKWKKIDVYPPIAKAIPAEPLDGILYRNRQRILDISEALGLSDADFDSLMMPVIRNFASFVHLLPSSENHHHRGAGGALKHSLEVAFWSARAAEDIIFCRNADPRERRKIEPLWRVATCAAGLLHDAGKPIADVTVTDEHGELWHPLEQPLYEYLRSKKREGYYISWRGGRYKRHEAFTQRAFDKIVPTSFVTHMMAHDPNIMFAIHDAFYSLDDSNHVAKIINWADHESVRRDAMEDVERKVGGDFDYGLPVHRHVFNSIRRLIQAGKWTINQPGAKVWHGDDGTFLVFKHGLTDIISDIKKEVGVTIRNDADGLVDELIQRGLVRPRYIPGGEPQSEEELGEYYLYWVITPKALENAGGGEPIKLTTIKIDSPERIFRNEVPAASDIKVWSTEELGGGFQPEFGSNRGVANLGGDHVSTGTGEVIANSSADPEVEMPGYGTTDPQAAPDAISGSDQGDVADLPFGNSQENFESTNQNTPTESTEQGASPENDPRQSLLHRAKQPKQSKPAQSAPKKPQSEGKSAKPEQEEPSPAGNDIHSVLAAIDDEMDLPFGGPTTESEAQAASEPDAAVDAPNDNEPPETSPESEPTKPAKEAGNPAPPQENKPEQPDVEPEVAKSSGAQAKTSKPKCNRAEKRSASSALNPLLKASSSKGKPEPNKAAPVKKMGKYKDIEKKAPPAAPFYEPVEGDSIAGFKQFIADNTSTGAGQIVETLVESVVDHGEVLGKRWFIEDGRIAIAYPSAFEGITNSSADALSRLESAKLLKANPKQPMSKVMEVHGVNSLVLDARTSEIIIAYLRVKEQSIDPLFVPPHPDLKVVRRPIKASPDKADANRRSAKNKNPTKPEKQLKNRSNSSGKQRKNPDTTNKQMPSTKPRNPEDTKPKEQVQSRHDMAVEAMTVLVDQMVEGTGELADDMKVDGSEKSVPHSVVQSLKIQFPKLTQSLARQSFWKAAKHRGYGWATNKGRFTLRDKES